MQSNAAGGNMGMQPSMGMQGMGMGMQPNMGMGGMNMGMQPSMGMGGGMVGNRNLRPLDQVQCYRVGWGEQEEKKKK